jgi:hypothetical protein
MSYQTARHMDPSIDTQLPLLMNEIMLYPGIPDSHVIILIACMHVDMITSNLRWLLVVYHMFNFIFFL